MKITKWMLLLLPAMLFSCGSDDDAGLGGDPVAVQFAAGNIAATRTASTASGTEWVQGDPIGVFMLKNGQTLSAAAIAEGADNVQYKAQASGNTTSGFTPASGIPIYYPHSGQVDFIAYYPYETPLTGYTLPIDAGDQSDASAIDVLYSGNAIGYDKTGGAVDLQFRHVLSKLQFSLIPGNGMAAPDLSGATVDITNLATTGDMDLANGTVAATNSGQTLMTDANYAAIVVPQTLTAGKLTVTLADGVNKFEWSFPVPTEWKTGLQYAYDITVSKTGITVATGGITDWAGAGDTPTEGRTFYKVGDYYPDPNNASTAIGVVFWVDPSDGRHGKVVGLEESSGVAWGPYGYSTGANDMANGRVNMRTIYNLGNDFSVYPAFAWVHSLNPANTDYSDPSATNVWYLPALYELGDGNANSLYVAYNADRAAFNGKLTAAGGTGLSDRYYWSSSEYDNYSAWDVYFNDGHTGNLNKASVLNRARCVLAF